MNKKITILFILFLSYLITYGQLDTVYYHQDFETDSLPGGIPSSWNERVPPSIFDWTTRNGGREVGGFNNPASAHEGVLNAAFIAQVGTHPQTYLMLPPIDLTYAIKPELNFFHAQEAQGAGPEADIDFLAVTYKIGENGEWQDTLEYYTLATPNETWVERAIQLPAGALADSCIIGFRAESNTGMGVCIDDIYITEKDTLSKYVNSITYNQATTNFVATESSENPILRIDIEIIGNTNTTILDSITINSENTDDSDIGTNGVKIFRTREPAFTADNQLGTEQSFSGGKAVFDLNYDIPYGMNYLWVTYDIVQDPTHEIHNHIADAYIDVNDIKIEGINYPSTAQHPTGNRTIIESVFFDDFETLKGWNLTPVQEFEIDTPQGKGNFPDHGLNGNTDPPNAYQGVQVLGSDLSGGAYDAFPYGYDTTLTDREYNAVSPLINCDYYRELKLIFQRWLNVQAIDTASIDISTDSGSSWSNLWTNSVTITEAAWSDQEIVLHDSMVYQPNVKVRFGIGPTTASLQYTGWNIDNFALVGNYIASDVTVTDVIAPTDGCGHTTNDSITITVENVGGNPTNDTIPVAFSPDGIIFVRDTIFGSIGVGLDTTYTFIPTVDMSVEGLYDDAFASTELPEDEYTGNDTFFTSIYVPPTFIPPYFENYENGNLHWVPDGTNSSWQFGEPGGSTIDSAYSADSCWVTDLSSNYNDNEDSYLESSCFNLLDINYGIIELKIFCNVEPGAGGDGAALEYSLDDGQSWDVVERLMYKDFDWDWYETAVTVLGSNGWNTASTEWDTVATFLPVALRDQSSVKFRIRFASDGDNNSYEGIAVDDIKIFEAPDDIKITSVDSPDTLICQQTSSELLTVSVANLGLDTILIGDTLFLGYDFTDGSDTTSVIDSIVLTQDIDPDDTIQVTYNTPIDLSTIGDYYLTVYSIEEDPYFYTDTPDDSIIDYHIEIKGNPIVDLGSDLYTVLPDTVTLVAYSGTTGYDYEWHDLSTDSIFDVSAEGSFYVTVTDPSTSCSTEDSTHIIQLFADIGIDSIFSPISDCELDDSVFIQSRIVNYGTDTLQVDDTLRIAYSIDSAPVKIDTFLLAEIIYPDSMYTFTSQDTFDLSAVKTYDIELYTILTDDNDANNDTIQKNITVYGYPAFNLQPEDTVVRAFQITLDAGAGFSSYLWNDLSTNQTLDVTSDGWYNVTVTDINNCSANDSSYVVFSIMDLSVTDFFSPTAACQLTDETVEIEISNLGSDTLFVDDTLIVAYDLDDVLTGTDSIIFTETFEPGDIINHTFNTLADMREIAIHEFECYTLAQGELVPGNDALISNVETMDGGPDVDLGGDTIRVGLPHLLDAGEGSGLTYLWSDESTGQTLYVQDYGTYSVTVTDSDNCFTIGSIVVAEIIEPPDPSAIMEVNGKIIELDIYPNPVSFKLNIELNTEKEIDVIIELIDMQGQVNYSNELKGLVNIKAEIDVSNYPDGPYLLKFIIDDKTITQRIIIQ